MTQAEEADGNTDERGERHGRSFKVAQAKVAEHDTGDTEQQDAPPAGEADLLVVKALDGNHNAVNEHPQDENHREGHRHEQIVGQEDKTDDNLQEGTEHTAAAVGQELLRAEGEDHLGETGNQRKASDYPRGGEEGSSRLADAKHAEGHEKDSRKGQPNFRATFHNFEMF